MFRRFSLILAFLVGAQGLVPPARAQPSDTAVKAAFLPRFARYVTWPPAAAPGGTEPFVLCVIGEDRFGRLLDNAANSQSIAGKPVSVRRMRNASEAAGCHVAFVQGTRAQSAGQILTALDRRPILTVTDAGNGSPRGVVHFAVINGRVRFFIDQGAAQRRGLTVSSRLLALAVGVKQ